MKKTFCILVVLMSVGCQPHTKQSSKQSFNFPTASEIKSQCETQTPVQVASRETRIWLCQSVSAIQYRFFDSDKYKGKTCDIIITQPLGRQPTGVTAHGGDPELCNAAVEAITQAIDSKTFPMRPESMKDEIPVRFAP